MIEKGLPRFVMRQFMGPENWSVQGAHGIGTRSKATLLGRNLTIMMGKGIVFSRNAHDALIGADNIIITFRHVLDYFELKSNSSAEDIVAAINQQLLMYNEAAKAKSPWGGQGLPQSLTLTKVANPTARARFLLDTKITRYGFPRSMEEGFVDDGLKG